MCYTRGVLMKNDQIKVLVVEDEILLLKNIQKKINAVSPNFIVLGEAFNGKEALEIIEHSHPDIVFTDIKMPIMDGLELSRIIYEKYPEICIVIVSGYDDFEYARSVLAYQVRDYLLKPLQLDVLKNLLFSLRETILARKASVIYQLLNDEVNGTSTITTYSDVKEELESCTFSIFIINFRNIHSKTTNLSLEEKQMLNDLPWHSILETVPYDLPDFWILPHESEPLYTVIIKNPTDNVVDMAVKLHGGLISLCQSAPRITVNLAYSNEKIDFSQLYSHSKKLHKLMFSSLVIGHSSIFTLSAIGDSLPPAVFSLNTINYLQATLVSNNGPGLQKVLLELFSQWEVNHCPQQWIEKMLMQLLTLLQQNLIFSDEEYENMKSNVFEILESEVSLSSAGHRITAELLHWVTLTQSVPSEIERTIEEMDNFIRTHYTKNLNLADLSEKYHFNHSYLTRIFKKQIGESPLQLINSLRIRDAQKLLENPELSVKEISDMLGFSSQHYFSRIFKDFIGRAPKEYRTPE